jgi:hypothetical protein
LYIEANSRIILATGEERDMIIYTMRNAACMVGLGILVAAIPARADVIALGLSAAVDGAPQGNSEALYASQNLGGDNQVNGCSVGLCDLLGDPTAAITSTPSSTAGGLFSYALALSAVGSSVTVSGSLATGNTGISMVSGAGGSSTETELGAGAILEDGLTFQVAGGGSADIGIQLSLNGSVNVPADGSYTQSILMDLGAAQLQWAAGYVNSNNGIPTSTIEAGTENWVSYTTPVQTPTGLVFDGILSVTSGQDLQFFLNQQLTCNVGATCNFADPLSISLNLPAGVTFTSDSGVFLSQAQPASPVPEPGAFGLTATCLLAAVALSRRTRRGTAK